MFFSYHIYYHFIKISNNNLIDNYYKNEETIQDNNKSKIKKMSNDSSLEEYLGILTIPKINLKIGFYNKNSEKNNVNKNVTLLKDSIMPEMDKSIVYLAAHSGTGYLAYFKDINKLTNNDMIYLNIDNISYSYIITDIYENPKNGEIIIDRNINEKYLVLTTCSKNKNMQLVIVSKMINRIWYNNIEFNVYLIN